MGEKGENSKSTILIFSAILDIIETKQGKSISPYEDLSKTMLGSKIHQM
jgi:hypothetical protein